MEIIKDFIEKELRMIGRTDKATRYDVNGHIEYLAEFGYDVSRPQADHVVTDIYELRPKNYRILYTYKNGKVYLLSIYKKSGSKVPQHELDKAIRRKKLL